MRNAMTGAVLSVLLAVQPAAATPPLPTLTQLFDFCGSQTMTEAEAKADQFGWRRMADADLHDWRAGFIAYNGGTVECRVGGAATTSVTIRCRFGSRVGPMDTGHAC